MRQITKKYEDVPVGGIAETQKMNVPDGVLDYLSDMAFEALKKNGYQVAAIILSFDISGTIVLPPRAPATAADPTTENKQA
jgi:hypothetical protein